MSGEIIQLSGSMSLIFETNDLSQASVCTSFVYSFLSHVQMQSSHSFSIQLKIILARINLLMLFRLFKLANDR